MGIAELKAVPFLPKTLVRVIGGLGFFVLVALPAAGQHGGFSGHSAGHISGHFTGHSGGHRGGHFFGHSSGGRGSRSVEPPLVGMQMARGSRAPVYVGPPVTLRAGFGLPASRQFVALARPPFPRFHHFHRFHHFGGFFGGFGAPFCDPFRHRFFFSSPFFFNSGSPCFGAGFGDSGLFLWDSGFFATTGGMVGDGTNAPWMIPEETTPPEMQEPAAGDAANLSAKEFAASQRKENPPQVTLLQLQDGSMYGLRDYWVEDGELHYVTDYGGENAVSLERIDVERTVQLNAEKGLPFAPRAKPLLK